MVFDELSGLSLYDGEFVRSGEVLVVLDMGILRDLDERLGVVF